jgi:hypothetical protein
MFDDFVIMIQSDELAAIDPTFYEDFENEI